jgi:alkanesulfonate monooxygenase SsuD/methylene tetrahydromethanopterin reductase-like flavin-dependent oxidoreductase (luciferase family)
LDLWVGDSVVAKPRLEPLTTLAYLAAMTQRSRLGTAVLLPALRQPTVLAHALANIDQLSQGRLVLGLGVGWALPEIEREWEACGRIHKRRRHDLEAHISVWRQLWSGEPVTYTDHDVRLTEHTIGPLPWHEAGPPILITAGNRGDIIPAQLDRFARLGDGIITTYLTEADCRTLRARGEEALAHHGRSLPHFPLCVYTTVRLDADVERAETTTRSFLQQYYGGGVHYRGLMGLGPASTVIDMIERYEAAGVTDLCIRLVGDDQVAQLEQFIHEVVPACTT